MNNIYTTINYRGAKIDTDGENKLKKSYPKLGNKITSTIRTAKYSVASDLIIDSYGRIYIKNPKYGIFKTVNPPCAKTNENRFSVNIVNVNNKKDTLNIELPNQKIAERLKDSFKRGALIPEGMLDLFNALEIAELYRRKINK